MRYFSFEVITLQEDAGIIFSVAIASIGVIKYLLLKITHRCRFPEMSRGFAHKEIRHKNCQVHYFAKQQCL